MFFAVELLGFTPGADPDADEDWWAGAPDDFLSGPFCFGAGAASASFFAWPGASAELPGADVCSVGALSGLPFPFPLALPLPLPACAGPARPASAAISTTAYKVPCARFPMPMVIILKRPLS